MGTPQTKQKAFGLFTNLRRGSEKSTTTPQRLTSDNGVRCGGGAEGGTTQTFYPAAAERGGVVCAV